MLLHIAGEMRGAGRDLGFFVSGRWASVSLSTVGTPKYFKKAYTNLLIRGICSSIHFWRTAWAYQVLTKYSRFYLNYF